MTESEDPPWYIAPCHGGCGINVEDESDKPPDQCDDWYCIECWKHVNEQRQKAKIESQHDEIQHLYWKSVCAQLAQVVIMQDCLQWRLASLGRTYITPELMAEFRDRYGKENGYL